MPHLEADDVQQQGHLEVDFAHQEPPHPSQYQEDGSNLHPKNSSFSPHSEIVSNRMIPHVYKKATHMRCFFVVRIYDI